MWTKVWWHVFFDSRCMYVHVFVCNVCNVMHRMLDEFFLEQMKEVVRLCSRSRQTMLFSATMTENVRTVYSLYLLSARQSTLSLIAFQCCNN